MCLLFRDFLGNFRLDLFPRSLRVEMASVLKTDCKRKYSEQSLLDGMEAVRDGMSVRKAAKNFHIPKSTLFEYEAGKHRGGKIGRPTLFTDNEENILARLLIRFAEIGIPYNKNHLRTLILQLAAGKGSSTNINVLRHDFFVFNVSHSEFPSLRI